MEISDFDIFLKDLPEEQRKFVEPLLKDYIFVAAQLENLRGYPFLAVNPVNPAQQRSTAAAKQYKDLLQQQINLVKLLVKATGGTEEDESPLRQYLERLKAAGGA